ncbi:DMT family transporter [Nesterenkonia natronophila]|uniref:DMT family transporter n=1 Tax=Nesterenkonia natronophila TaxID=2174932 RepID=A0A3A4FJ01_9MICC|nr:DMT family transporter [Nesterenkonia natronophila]RJN32325.1 DMT family transporter [Nesterenkonia natronophila]
MEKKLAVGAIVATVAMWASSFVVIRAFAEELSPGPLGLLRLLAGVITLSVMLLWLRRGRARLPGRRGLLLGAAFGVVWFAVYTLAFNWAGHFLDAGTIAMLVNLAPLMIALGGGFFFGEGFPRQLFAGMAVSLLGIGLITFAGTTGRLSLAGLLIALAAAVLYAVGMLIQKLTLRHTDPLTATWIACAAGVVALLPFIPQTIAEVGDASAGSIVGAVYMGIGPTALAFMFWGYAMMQFPAGRVAASTLSVPAIVVVMAWIFLAEVPPALAIIGGVICLVGVAIVQWRTPRRRGRGSHAEPTPDRAPAPA